MRPRLAADVKRALAGFPRDSRAMNLPPSSAAPEPPGRRVERTEVRRLRLERSHGHSTSAQCVCAEVALVRAEVENGRSGIRRGIGLVSRQEDLAQRLPIACKCRTVEMKKRPLERDTDAALLSTSGQIRIRELQPRSIGEGGRTDELDDSPAARTRTRTTSAACEHRIAAVRPGSFSESRSPGVDGINLKEGAVRWLGGG